MKQKPIPENVKKALAKYRKTLDMDALDLTLAEELKGKDRAEQDDILMSVTWNLVLMGENEL
jgi:hypothetical protein